MDKSSCLGLSYLCLEVFLIPAFLSTSWGFPSNASCLCMTSLIGDRLPCTAATVPPSSLTLGPISIPGGWALLGLVSR